MSQPYLSEIRIMSFPYAPPGWAMCNGQIMTINQNQALFSLIGSSFGGDGIKTFGLPNMPGRTPLHSSTVASGVIDGEPVHTLQTSEMPTHTHSLNAESGPASGPAPAGNMLANSNPNNIYGPAQNLSAANPTTVTNVGSSQPHENMQPYLVLNFCIALQGIYPSKN
jgi:microcystin-dependent protein